MMSDPTAFASMAQTALESFWKTKELAARVGWVVTIGPIDGSANSDKDSQATEDEPISLSKNQETALRVMLQRAEHDWTIAQIEKVLIDRGAKLPANPRVVLYRGLDGLKRYGLVRVVRVGKGGDPSLYRVVMQKVSKLGLTP